MKTMKTKPPPANRCADNNKSIENPATLTCTREITHRHLHQRRWMGGEGGRERAAPITCGFSVRNEEDKTNNRHSQHSNRSLLENRFERTGNVGQGRPHAGRQLWRHGITADEGAQHPVDGKHRLFPLAAGAAGDSARGLLLEPVRPRLPHQLREDGTDVRLGLLRLGR